MNFNRKTLFFYIFARWLSKVNMLPFVYKIKDELILFFEARRKQGLFLSIKSKILFDVSKLGRYF